MHAKVNNSTRQAWRKAVVPDEEGDRGRMHDQYAAKCRHAVNYVLLICGNQENGFPEGIDVSQAQRSSFLFETKEIFAFDDFTLIPNNFLVIMLRLQFASPQARRNRFQGRRPVHRPARRLHHDSAHETRSHTIFDWRTSSESF